MVKDQKLLKIIKEIQYYLNNSESDKNNNGLYSGNSGILLTDAYYNYYNNGESVFSDKKFDEITDILFNSINNPTQGIIFSAGLSGQLWSLYNMKLLGYIDVDESVFQSYSEYMKSALLSYANANQWDNLHGAFGILYYLNQSNTLDEKVLNEFLDIYKLKTYKNDHFEFYKTKVTITSDDETYNFSLSHGLSGQVLILSHVLKKNPSHLKLETILYDLVEFVLKYKRKNNHSNAIFPSTIYQLNENDNENPSRLAWCYGDLGTCYALYVYSKQRNDEVLLNETLSSLEFLSNKKGIRENIIFDAPLCHGTSGVMQIFNRLYYETGFEYFRNASVYWLEQTLSFYDQSNSISTMGAWRPDAKEFLQNEGILEGYAGIQLSILANLHPDIEPKWDGCLFLS